jgi:small subunit ribosomal protein S27e
MKSEMSSWGKIIPKPRSTFIKVKCPECGNEQILFSHSTTLIRCKICNATLAHPTGGKVRIHGEVVDVLQ